MSTLSVPFSLDSKKHYKITQALDHHENSQLQTFEIKYTRQPIRYADLLISIGTIKKDLRAMSSHHVHQMDLAEF